MRREKQQHEASVASVVREALKARRTRISAMLEHHTFAQVRLILAQMGALSGRNKRDNESLKRELVNTTKSDEELIGQVASLALAHESAEDMRRFHCDTGNRATNLEWPQQPQLEIWPIKKRIKRVTTFVRIKLRKSHLPKLAAKWCPNEVALHVPSNTVATLNGSRVLYLSGRVSAKPAAMAHILSTSLK
jgi:hypothetical protein